MVEPIRCLVGQLSDEKLQDGAQVTLAAHRHHLHSSGHGRVTVTARRREREDVTDEMNVCASFRTM